MLRQTSSVNEEVGFRSLWFRSLSYIGLNVMGHFTAHMKEAACTGAFKSAINS